MNKLPKRKQIRLDGYDYSQSGMYFVTVCTKDGKPLLHAVATKTYYGDNI